MRKWYIPLTVVSLSGIGVLLLTERGKRAVKWLMKNAPQAPGKLLDWNEATQLELEKIQKALDRMAQMLEDGNGTRPSRVL